MIRLRRAGFADLAYVVALERQFTEMGLVGCDSEEVHRQRMEGADTAYLVIEREGQPAGFVILCGLGSSNRSIELKRIAVSEPGMGTGREALRQVASMAFAELSAHRLWLDVYTDNERARRTYRAIGFVEEGIMRECIWHGNRFRSLALMSLLEREFSAPRQSP